MAMLLRGNLGRNIHVFNALPPPGEEMSQREQEIAQLQKDWKENPRWKGV
jgi:hypothetical protein